jgi:hypothetical protein
MLRSTKARKGERAKGFQPQPDGYGILRGEKGTSVLNS